MCMDNEVSMAGKLDGTPGVTIYEIAKHLGLSPAAVSSALANRGKERRISAETIRRIREAATELGYVPNMAGRRLRAHKSSVRQFDLAILTSFEAPLPLVGQALHALQRAVDSYATAHTRYAVAIEMFHSGKLIEKPGLLDANRYHGVIITNTLPEDDAMLAQARLPYPVVILGRRIPGYHCVLEAPDVVGRHSADILIEAGCRHPVVLHGRSLTLTTSNRLDAFNQRLTERTKQPAVALMSDGLRPENGAAAIESYLSNGGKIDGLFTVTDSLAVGAYKTLKQRGFNIPTDVAAVGVGDYDLAEFFDPPLTTVAGANDAMVAEAVPLLFRILHGEKDVPKEILVVPPVIVRASAHKVRSVHATNSQGSLNGP